ncbi:unnamed protein product, partial [Rotaria sp. Silwood1]
MSSWRKSYWRNSGKPIDFGEYTFGWRKPISVVSYKYRVKMIEGTQIKICILQYRRA